MAEIVGLVASVIAIIQLTGKVTSLSYGYVSAFKRAPKDLGDLIDELGSLSKVLIILQDYAKGNNQSKALQQLNLPNGPLQGCLNELQKLQSKLELDGLADRLKWPLREKDTLQHIARIERHKSLFSFALTADNASLSRAIEEYVKETRLVVHHLQSDIKDTTLAVQNFRADFEDEITAQSIRRQKEDDLRRSEKRMKILNWLYPGRFDQRHIEVSSRRQKDTGGWLLKQAQLRRWVEGKESLGSGSRLLWGYGIPGAGKTFLSSVVIEHLQAMALLENYGVAYIYCNYKEQDSQKPIHIIASLVKQLASQISYPVREIEELYNSLEPRSKEPTLQQFYEALLAASRSFDQVFLVFDALDECDEKSQRKELLPLIHRMAENGIYLFVTSRQHPEDIQGSLNNVPKIELSAQADDITMYIERKIDESRRASRLVRQAKCKERIISEILECSEGMFLLVHFHVEYFCQQTTAKQMLLALDKLKSSPNGERSLHPIYNRAMETIHRQNDNSSDLAKRVLSWLVKAKRTLTVRELQTAVAVESERYELDELDLTDRATLLDVCAGLVTIDENSDTIQLAHYTVQEYLLETSATSLLVDAPFQLAMACITFLSFEEFAKGACKSTLAYKARVERHPFLEYAAYHLSFHLKGCDEDLTTEMVLRFIESPGNISSYLQVLCHRYETSPPQQRTPLHLASGLGHRAAVRLLLDGERDYQDSNGDTALHIALDEGQEEVACLLLKEGVDFSLLNTDRRTALHIAASNANDFVFQLLPEEGANLSVPDSDGNTALHVAAYHGAETAMRLLLQKGADTSILNRYGWSALHRAAFAGHESVVRLLLDKGADFSVQNEDHNTALHLAALKGHGGIIKLLVNKGADFSTPGQDGRIVLHDAALWGCKSAVELLLEKGADGSVLNNYGYTALQAAVSASQVDVVQLLLEKGTELSTLNSDGETALRMAAFGGSKEIVQLLLQHGSDISDLNKIGWTVLHTAAFQGHEAVVQLLLQNGADFSNLTTHGQSALYLAAYKGHESIVLLLLEKGPDMSVSCNGCTALHKAASQGHEGIVQLLLEKGVDFSLLDNNGWSALHFAASAGYDSIARMLLEKGADPSVCNNYGETPLHLAVEGNLEAVGLLPEGLGTSIMEGEGEKAPYKAMAKALGVFRLVQLLLNWGADPSSIDNNARTVVYRAAAMGNSRLVQLLLESGVDLSLQVKDGRRALHAAAAGGHELVVRLLLTFESVVDLKLLDNNGSTILHAAAYGGNEAVVEMLVERGIDISISNNDGQTALLTAVSRRRESVVGLLLEKGADLSVSNKNGMTALHLAAFVGHRAIVQLLLEYGADFSVSNNSGRTPLHIAASAGHDLVVTLLLDVGASLSALDEDGSTALHAATYRGHHEVARLLIQYGGDLSAQDYDGWTVFHTAVFGGNELVIELLIENEADTSVPNNKGETPLFTAVSRQNEKFVELLLERGVDCSIPNLDGLTPLELAVLGGNDLLVEMLETTLLVQRLLASTLH